MQKITSIQEQLKNKTRVNVYINNTYSFSCNKEIIVKYKLKEGLNINKDDITQLVEETNKKHSFEMALHYLSFKSRTKQEIINYLLKKGFENNIINNTIEKLTLYKFVDDKKHAINFINNAIREKKKSSSLVKTELIKKGIDIQIVEECISIFSYNIDLDIANEISKKYFNKKQNLPFKQFKDKLSQLLLRKGFSWEIVNKCISNLENSGEVQTIIDSNKEKFELQAIKLANKYFCKYSKKENNPYLLEKKVKHALYRKGYDIDIINTAFNNINNV